MFSYDEFPYESATTRTTHPDHVGTIAFLFGLDPAPVERARVLEIGCGTGANLIPFAADHPAAHCLGIDLSSPAIADGNACIEALGLANVKLRNESFEETPADIGTFDIIIVNGVYTWIPVEQRAALLALCHDRLAPDGVAMLGYHTLPGWRFTGAVRDMLRFSAAGAADATARIALARRHIAFAADAAARRPGFYADHLRDAAARVAAKNETHFFHEYLGDENHPVYFHQFMADARRHDLAYVWDAAPDTGFIDNFPPDVAAELREMSDDQVALEQWIDFITNRRWRNSIVARSGSGLPPALIERRIRSCAILSRFRPIADGPATPAGGVRFRDHRGTEVTPGLPATTRALEILAARWPRTIGFDELAAQVAAISGARNPDAVAAELTSNLLRMMFLGSITLMRAPIDVGDTSGERPEASAFARWQALRRPYVLDRHHTTVALGEDERALLALLDGSRDRRTLDAEWRPSAASAERERPDIDAALRSFVDRALLIG